MRIFPTFTKLNIQKINTVLLKLTNANNEKPAHIPIRFFNLKLFNVFLEKKIK